MIFAHSLTEQFGNFVLAFAHRPRFLCRNIASMSDARALFRATTPVQIGPCRGGDSFLEVRVQPNALRGIVIWWSLPAVYDFLCGPKHQALLDSVVSVGKLGTLSWEQQSPEGLLTGNTLASTMREDGGLLRMCMHSVLFALAVAMVFCPCPNMASGVLV